MRYSSTALVLGLTLFVSHSVAKDEPEATPDKGQLLEQASGQLAVPYKKPRQTRKGARPASAPKAEATDDDWWLHVKWHRNCYPFYAEYYAEAKVTRGPDFNSPERTVQKMTIGSYGPWRFSKTCQNTSVCAKDMRDYNLGCKRPICATGSAMDPSGTAGTSSFERGC